MILAVYEVFFFSLVLLTRPSRHCFNADLGTLKRYDTYIRPISSSLVENIARFMFSIVHTPHCISNTTTYNKNFHLLLILKKYRCHLDFMWNKP